MTSTSIKMLTLVCLSAIPIWACGTPPRDQRCEASPPPGYDSTCPSNSNRAYFNADARACGIGYGCEAGDPDYFPFNSLEECIAVCE